MRWCRGVGDLLQMTNHVVILLAGSWDSILCMPKSTYLLQAQSHTCKWGSPALQYYAVKCFILSHAHESEGYIPVLGAIILF